MAIRVWGETRRREHVYKLNAPKLQRLISITCLWVVCITWNGFLILPKLNYNVNGLLQWWQKTFSLFERERGINKWYKYYIKWFCLINQTSIFALLKINHSFLKVHENCSEHTIWRQDSTKSKLKLRDSNRRTSKAKGSPECLGPFSTWQVRPGWVRDQNASSM